MISRDVTRNPGRGFAPITHAHFPDLGYPWLPWRP
jgi:hypothetical protein